MFVMQTFVMLMHFIVDVYGSHDSCNDIPHPSSEIVPVMLKLTIFESSHLGVIAG